MAAALAIVGNIANILQLTEISCTVASRIIEYFDRTVSAARELRDTVNCLPLLMMYLENIKHNPHMQDPQVQPVVMGLKQALEDLEWLIVQLVPHYDDDWVVRWTKSMKSMRAPDQLRLAEMRLDKYKSTLILYSQNRTVVEADLRPMLAKRGKFFSYGRRPSFAPEEPPKMYREAYNEVMTSLLVRKRKVQGASVVNLQFRNGFLSDPAFMRYICRSME